MIMIDWWNVFTHSLWIVGLATALAIWSHADWQAALGKKGMRETLRRVSDSPGFALALALICLGASLGVPRGWERLLWLLLVAASLTYAALLWFSQHKGAKQ